MMIKIIGSLYFSMALNFGAFAQVSQKPINQYLLNQANEKIKRGDFYDAIPDLENLVKENPDNIEIQLKYGICIAEAGQNRIKAIPFLKNANRANQTISKFYLGKVYYSYMQFDSAYFFLNDFLKLRQKDEKLAKEAQKMADQLFDAMLLMNQPNVVKMKNLGKGVNSSYADYSPIIKADNSVLYFTSKREDSKGRKQDENNKYYEDIYISKYADSLFEPAENAGSPLNTNEHDATVALSADGNTMIIYRTDPYSGSGDLFLTKKEGLDWSNPIKMGLNINSLYQETSASLSSDGNVLYFASNRPGGFGGFDIYKSTRGKNGVWAPALNLGSKINSKYDEESPCIGADGKVLYFSSKGHEPNMGGFDIFKSECDEFGKWQKPSNLGFPINTLKDDVYFTISANAKKGYLSSNRIDLEGDLDIYEFDLNEKQPSVTLLTGTVKESSRNEFIKAEIEIWDRDKNKLLFKTSSNTANGEFLIILPNEINLKLIFEKGRGIFTDIIDSKADGKFHEIFKTIELETD